MMFALAGRSTRLACSLAILVLAAMPALAALPIAPADRAKVVGQPVGLDVQPATVTLTGPRSMQQLVVTGRYPDGTVRDLTPFVEVKAEAGDILTISEEQMV